MATSENETEILRIVRKIREDVLLLPDKVADQMADQLRRCSTPTQTPNPAPINEEIIAPVIPPDEPCAESASRQVELAEITQERDKAQAELDYLAASLAQHNEKLEELSQGLVVAKAEADSVVAEKREVEAEVIRLLKDAESARSEVKHLASRREELETDLIQARALISEAEPIGQSKEAAERTLVQLEARRAEFEGYRRAGENAHLLLERFWPEWLRNGTLAQWKERIESGVFDAASPPSFALLFAAIHTYNAAIRDSDPKTLHDSLRDVGRRLYAWLRDIGQSDGESATIAEQWAQSINSDCAGRGEIEVPIPGNAANNQWMLFQPRGGSSPDVASVRSWCVRDAQKRPVHRAEITV